MDQFVRTAQRHSTDEKILVGDNLQPVFLNLFP